MFLSYSVEVFSKPKHQGQSSRQMPPHAI